MPHPNGVGTHRVRFMAIRLPITMTPQTPVARLPLMTTDLDAVMRRVAHRCAVARVRSTQTTGRSHLRYRAGSPSAQPTTRDHPAPVADCLSSLSGAQRDSIQFAYYDGFTYPQVSQQLSANLAMIKQQIRDTISGLRGHRDVA
jgi:DNA-directed RNA polymerase specialized sigma24 family protein